MQNIPTRDQAPFFPRLRNNLMLSGALNGFDLLTVAIAKTKANVALDAAVGKHLDEVSTGQVLRCHNAINRFLSTNHVVRTLVPPKPTDHGTRWKTSELKLECETFHRKCYSRGTAASDAYVSRDAMNLVCYARGLIRAEDWIADPQGSITLCLNWDFVPGSFAAELLEENSDMGSVVWAADIYQDAHFPVTEDILEVGRYLASCANTPCVGFLQFVATAWKASGRAFASVCDGCEAIHADFCRCEKGDGEKRRQ